MHAIDDLTDPLPLARALIERQSVTPADDGALDSLQAALERLGFGCRRLRFAEVDNLYARRGAAGPNLCFAGHTDVVPVGDAAAWTRPPFAATVDGDTLWGRGAVDMKSAIAAFVAAIARVTADGAGPTAQAGAVSLLITGDEEGPGLHGTKAVLPALHADGERIDHCLVGEPTSAGRLGDQIKIGRRGSLNAVVTVEGRQGHVAYPERAENPVPILLTLLDRLRARMIDQGPVPHFQPSNLEITSVDVGNRAHNVIPAQARARFNIRFNTAQRGADLAEWIEREVAAAQGGFGAGFDGDVHADIAVTGEAFLTPTGPFTALLHTAVTAETGAEPVFSTGGGTSDARFIKDYAPVAELGLVGTTMHQVDERVPLADIETLTRIYARILRGYFADPALAPAG